MNKVRVTYDKKIKERGRTFQQIIKGIDERVDVHLACFPHLAESEEEALPR